MSYSNALLLVSGNNWLAYLEAKNNNYTLGYSFYMGGNQFPNYYYINQDPAQGFNATYSAAVIPGNEASITTAQGNLIKYFLSDTSGVDFRVSFSDVASINFEQKAGNTNIGEIFISNGNVIDSVAKAVSPGGLYDTWAGDIFLDNVQFSSLLQANLSVGLAGSYAILHELAHSIAGLNDLNETSLPNDFQKNKYTIMGSLTSFHPDMASTVFPTGLQLYDIAAIQEIYGRDYTTRSSDNIGIHAYKIGNGFAASASTPFIYTLWDGGGIDTIDAAGYLNGVQIDLRQGHFSSIGKSGDVNDPVLFDDLVLKYDAGNVAIAYHTIIENAIGTADDDILIGNSWSNHLIGGGGRDELYGGGKDYDGKTGFIGIDVDDPNDPNRTISLWDNDVLNGGEGDDLLNGGSGSDTGDYSADPANIDVQLDNRGDGTVRDGWGDTDTLISIEKITGTGFADNFNVSDAATLTGRFYDGGGGVDTFTAMNVTYDMRATSAQESHGIGLAGFESVELSGVTTIIADDTRDFNFANFLGGTANPNDRASLINTLDYSAATHAGVFRMANHIVQAENNDVVTINGHTHTYGDNETPNNSYGTASMGGVGTIKGTNHGDTVYLWAKQAAVMDPMGDNPHSVTFVLGAGNDVVHNMSASGAHLVYTKGDDVVDNMDRVVKLTLASSIMYEDVSISRTADSMLLTIRDHGSMMLTGYLGLINNFKKIHFASGGYIDFLNDDAMVGAPSSYQISGTWNDEILYDRVGYGGAPIFGLGGNDALYGYDGHDTLDGGDGDDILDGGSGNDILMGGVGNDRLIASDGNDSLSGGLGNDSYEYSLGKVIISEAGIGADGDEDTLKISAGYTLGDIIFLNAYKPADMNSTGYDDLIISLGSGDSITLVNQLHNSVYAGASSIEWLELHDGTTIDFKLYGTPEWNLIVPARVTTVFAGTEVSETILGSSGADDIYGYDGNDTLNGGAGVDVMYGGDGNDIYVVDTSSDIVIEHLGQGTDAVQSNISYALWGHIENLVLTGTSSINGTGNDLANTITGNSGNNMVNPHFRVQRLSYSLAVEAA